MKKSTLKTQQDIENLIDSKKLKIRPLTKKKKKSKEMSIEENLLNSNLNMRYSKRKKRKSKRPKSNLKKEKKKKKKSVKKQLDVLDDKDGELMRRRYKYLSKKFSTNSVKSKYYSRDSLSKKHLSF